jgi:glutamine cyclotransferase
MMDYNNNDDSNLAMVDGTATIEYYMPDSTAPQDIVIEGVSKNGKICRYTKTINQPSN